MDLSGAAKTQLTPDLPICRLLNGLWQVSGAHGPIDRRAAIQDMFAYHDAGFTTWDLAQRRTLLGSSDDGSPQNVAWRHCRSCRPSPSGFPRRGG
jgi:hypothetical protein